MNRLCSRCGKLKNISDFTKDRTRASGLSYWCRDCGRTKKAAYRAAHTREIAEKGAIYRRKNKAAIRKKASEKRRTNRCFAMQENCRRRILLALKEVGQYKQESTMELIGCSPNMLRRHIESLWAPGMSWDNHGIKGWHIDHVKPCKVFNLAKKEERLTCFHYTNLQPLWWRDNLAKGAKV